MKRNLLLTALAFCVCVFTTNAAVLTVSNNAGSPAQYNTFAAAYTAATAGDTIYLHGSQNSYGNLSLTNKNVTIIGAGALPNKNNKWTTIVGQINLNAGITGTRIHGIRVDYIYFYFNNVSDLLIEGCRVNQIYAYTGYILSNIVLRNNVVNSFASNGNIRLDNCLFEYNLFGGIGNTSYTWGDSNNGNLLLTNNIIAGSIACRRAIIANNIFYNAGAATNFILANTDQCTLDNNCFKNNGSAITLANIVFGSNSGSGNLLNVDPDFEYAPGNAYNTVYGYGYNSAGPYVNFNLKNTSACINAGTDGTDIGLYGGLTPFREQYPYDNQYRYYPNPTIPIRLDMKITNSSVLQNSNINVNFKAKKVE